MARKKKPAKPPKSKGGTSHDADVEMDDQQVIKPSVFIPGKDTMEDGETLEYDPTAYDCMSQMQLEWPALSFDVIRDSLGPDRRNFPHTLFMVAGTQASSAKLNYLAVMKVVNLSSGKEHGRDKDGDESDEESMALEGESDDDEEEQKEEAVLHVRRVAHTGGINRIRSMPQQPHVVASWSDSAQVQVWDVSSFLLDLEKAETVPPGGSSTKGSSKGKIQKLAALQVHTHSSEGFAMDWSPVHEGRLVSGDCRAKIHVWEPSSGGKWRVGGALKGHESSVEDLQWSPTEATVFASASVDRTIRVWDTRDTTQSMLTVPAHDTDVNVISWNRLTAYMLASGADDGSLKIWDLRTFGSSSQTSPVANFSYHRGPVTSVEWCPYEPSMLSTTSSDNTVAIWDLALERDPEEEAALAPETNAAAPEDLPAQLLFLHAGQHDLKEGHWHPQIPGLFISTAFDGFNLFKPSNV